MIKGRHTQACEGYEIVSTEAKNQHQGGVALVFKKSELFSVEGTRSFGPNVISTTLVSGRKKWTIIGAYIPPSEVDCCTIEFIQAEAANACPEHPTILLGDLNVDFAKTSNIRQYETAALVDALGLYNLQDHSIQKKRNGKWTFAQHRENLFIRSICDHILTTERKDFKNFRVVTPRFDSDHRMIVAALRTDTILEHRSYVKKRSKFPFQPKHPLSRTDLLMEELKRSINQPIHQNSRHNSWISNTTWRIMDAKAVARKRGDSEKAKNLSKLLRNI
jgi:hypothetical protein